MRRTFMVPFDCVPDTVLISDSRGCGSLSIAKNGLGEVQGGRGGRKCLVPPRADCRRMEPSGDSPPLPDVSDLQL